MTEKIACEFAEWLNQNRWFTFDKEKQRWFYTFEHGTSISDASYLKNYTKTTSELYRRFLKEIKYNNE